MPPAPPDAIGADPAAACAAPGALALLRGALRAGPLVVHARGHSMRPGLRAGDRVRLEARPPRVGDVVLAVHGGRLVLHRAVRRRGAHWLLRGDARPAPDGWLPGEDVLAVAVARARGGAPWRRIDGPLARGLARPRTAVLRAARVVWARSTAALRRARDLLHAAPA